MKEKAAARRLGQLLSQVAPTACAAEQDDGWAEYRDKAVKRAHELGNRSPIRFDADGRLAQDIQDAYWRCGFYVFENVMRPEEVVELNAEFDAFLANAPASSKSKTDKFGRPVKLPNEYLYTGKKADGTPATVSNLAHPMRCLDSALRLYGHPQLLRVAEAFNGPDFTPFAERIYHKEAGVGPPTFWHQDGVFNWDKSGVQSTAMHPDGTPEQLGCHGFTLHGAFSQCEPENCLWVVPGSHLRKGFVFPDGSEWRVGKGRFPDPKLADNDRLPDAVPMLMNPGDVGMHNRCALHGAFSTAASGFPERRLTMIFGFQNRRFVLGVKHRDPIPFKFRAEMLTQHPPADKQHVIMDEEYIRKSTRMIAVAIDARRQKYPDETPYVYKPLAGEADKNRWNEQTREEVVNMEGRYYITN